MICVPHHILFKSSSPECWPGHVARMGDRRGSYRVLVGRPNGKDHLDRPRSRQKSNIKMDLQKAGFGAWAGLIWLRICRRSGRF
jgi:hypothetical protein